MVKVVGLDTVILIYALENNPTFGPLAKRILQKVERGKLQAVFSSIGLLEILTGARKAGRSDLVQRYNQLLRSYPYFSIIDTNEHIINQAAVLRAHYHIRTPDAIHLATALFMEADCFYTNDTALLAVSDINVKLLS